METLRDIVVQEMIEERYNRKHIDAKIRKEILSNPEMLNKIDQGVQLLEDWLSKTYYESKNKRLAQVKLLDLNELVLDIYVGIAYFLRPELFTSATAQLSARLGWDDKVAAITTVAEIVAVLCHTDAFDITKESKYASLYVESRIPLSDKLIEFIEGSEYLPPMLCQPLELTHNFSSGYLTHNDSLILKAGNHHDGDICLDVLNLMNSVPLKLDTEFLCQMEERPNEELETQDQIESWNQFKKQSYIFYNLMVKNGNRFWFTHKVDKRGRIYSQGYHINPQGSSFKKAMLEFADEEIVEGVPNDMD